MIKLYTPYLILYNHHHLGKLELLLHIIYIELELVLIIQLLLALEDFMVAVHSLLPNPRSRSICLILSANSHLGVGFSRSTFIPVRNRIIQQLLELPECS